MPINCKMDNLWFVHAVVYYTENESSLVACNNMDESHTYK